MVIALTSSTVKRPFSHHDGIVAGEVKFVSLLRQSLVKSRWIADSVFPTHSGFEEKYDSRGAVARIVLPPS